MATQNTDPVISKVLVEKGQQHETRKTLFADIENKLKMPIVSLFTSFIAPVGIEDSDAQMLEGILQKMDLSKGLALFIDSPGGDPLAAERIINICRSYSGSGEYWAIVPGKAKSAATLICFGASKICMGASSELGAVDPQYITVEDREPKRFSVFNIVESYDELFKKAVAEKGNLEPYLQQLARYDERQIKEFRTAMALSEDSAIKSLKTGMLQGMNENDIKKNIEKFLTPKETKDHGRPIYRDEAKSCGLNIDFIDIRSDLWQKMYELYIRTNYFVLNMVAKCIESKDLSFMAPIPK